MIHILAYTASYVDNYHDYDCILVTSFLFLTIIYRAVVCSVRTNVVQTSKMHFVLKALLVVIGFWARQSNGKWADWKAEN